ncbi:sensor histidine kinase [Sphingomonas cavernae]|nr:histidine kinase [Sphingomonas cavernae]
METGRNHPKPYVSLGGTAEQKTVLALIAAYWVGFQIIYYTYGNLVRPDGATEAKEWLLGLAAYFVSPVELVVCSSGALLCYAIYLVVKAVKRRIFWQQLVVAVLVMIAGAFIFSVIVRTTVAANGGPPVTLPGLVRGGIFWIAPIGVWTVTVLALSHNTEVGDRERRLAVLQAQANEAHVRALRFQVNPHFLYNTLNSISALILEHRERDAEQMVLALASFFRTTLTADPLKDVRLADEIALQKLYLDIEQIRFADCLAVEIDMPPTLDEARLPGLILQPLIENALKHGVREPGETMLIKIGARAEGDLLVVEVRDNGPGNAVDGSGAGIGLPNVRERLASRFGERAQVDTTMAPSGFTVRLTMPLEFA